MAAADANSTFIRSAFRSVWALELLLQLRRTSDRAWSAEQLVEILRASALIVEQGLEDLMRAGLVSIDADGCARYQPSSAYLEEQVDATQRLYLRKPETVRRMIVSAGNPSLVNFAEAFRIWRD